MKKILLGIGALLVATAAWAWQQTVAGTITWIGSGWNADAMWVQTTAPLLATGCTYNHQYTTDPNSPERKAHHAVLLTAQAMGKPIIITIDGCWGTYPRIIGVAMQN
jgi:hypothetical protein